VSRPADLRRTVAPFERYHQRYDDWFEQHRVAYVSELIAERALLPWRGRDSRSATITSSPTRAWCARRA
jgi:hypothetical protein